jgi:glycosyltransferase involved in cell wall biosynthesis
MRLLVVSSWYPYPPDNGSRMRAHHLVRHLSRRHEVTLLSLAPPATAEDLAAVKAMCQRVEVAPAPPRSGPGRAALGLMSPTPRHLVQRESRETRGLLARLLPGQHAAIGLQVDAAWYLSPHASLPRVFEEVEVSVYREQYLHEARPLPRLRNGLTWWKFHRFVRELVDRCDHATVVSATEREHLRAIGCDVDRVTVVPNGIEVPELGPTAVRADRLIYPGSVTYSANLDAVRFFVRDVLPGLRRVRPELTFCVTGSTDGVDVSDLQVPGVTFTGRLPGVDRLVAESAVCVVPLRIGGGTRLKVLQAMALGTPVVSTSKGVEGLEVEPGRHVLVADSAEALASEVLRVLGEPGLASRLGDEAQQLARARYGWGPIGDALERVVAEAMASHAARPGANQNARVRR